MSPWQGHTDWVSLKIEVYFLTALEAGVEGQVKVLASFISPGFTTTEPAFAEWKPVVSVYTWFLLKRTLVILE